MKSKSNKTLVQRVFIAAIAISLSSFILTSCGEEKPDPSVVKAREEMRMAVTHAIESRDSMIQAMVYTFDEIDANLEVIREKESELRSWADGEEVMGRRQDRIVRDIQVINTLMEGNRKEIAALRSRLRKSGIDVTALESRLNQMELANTEKTAELEDLKAKLLSAETSLAGLNDTLTQKSLRIALQDQVISSQSLVINDQDDKMHQAYVATGSYKELKARGLVTKEGAILGLGGDKEFTAKTDPEEFALIDQRDQVMIPILSKKAVLITHHPDGSYKFKKDDEGKVNALEITKPEEFWQSSRYLIVATD